MQIDDSIRLTKFIQQNTTNTKYKQLAQTIFTTPNMTLGRAASLFETYNPPSGPATAPTTPTVNAVICRYCKGKDHKLSDCPEKKPISDKKKAKKPYSSSSAHAVQPNASGSLVQYVTLWITCLTCALVVRKSRGVSLSPPAGQLHPRTARIGSHPSGGARQGEAGDVMMNSRKDLSDGVVRDKVTQLRSLRKPRFCL